MTSKFCKKEDFKGEQFMKNEFKGRCHLRSFRYNVTVNRKQYWSSRGACDK